MSSGREFGCPENGHMKARIVANQAVAVFLPDSDAVLPLRSQCLAQLEASRVTHFQLVAVHHSCPVCAPKARQFSAPFLKHHGQFTHNYKPSGGVGLSNNLPNVTGNSACAQRAGSTCHPNLENKPLQDTSHCRGLAGMRERHSVRRCRKVRSFRTDTRHPGHRP